MAAKGASWKAGVFVPPKGTAVAGAHGEAPGERETTSKVVRLRGDLKADDGLQAMRERLAELQETPRRRRLELISTQREAERRAETLQTKAYNARTGARRAPTKEKRQLAQALHERLSTEAGEASAQARAASRELATLPRMPSKLTARYQPILERLADAQTPEERNQALADLKAMRAQRSREQNRSQRQGDLFGGFSPEARAEHGKVAKMRARIARLPELRKQRDEVRAQRAARHRSVEKARERTQASAAGRSMGETRATRAASIASLPSAPKGQHYVTDRDGKVSLAKTIARKGGLAIHRDEDTDRFHAADVRSGLTVATFGTRGGAEAFARAAGKSLDRTLTRAAVGDDKAVRAVQRVTKRYANMDAQRTPSRTVVRTGAVKVEGWNLTGPRVVLGKGTGGDHELFVQRTNDRGGRWLRFSKKSSGNGFWVSAYKTRELAIEGR